MHLFNKSERLNNKIVINNLFENGASIALSPFRLIWIEHNNSNQPIAKTLISVPKRNVNLATQRNLIKRRVNEAFRLNKERLYIKLKKKNKQINMAFIYQNSEIQSYRTIEQKINLLLSRLIDNL